MKKFKKTFDYINIIKYIVVLFLFIITNFLESEVLPYSTSIYSSLLCLNLSYFSTSIFFLLSFILVGRPGLIASSAISVGVFFIISLIKLKFRTKKHIEYVFYTAISMLGFIFLGDTSIQINIEKRILCTILSAFLTLIFCVALNAVDKKLFRYKMNKEEQISLIVFLLVFGLGISNFTSPFVWKTISVLIILICLYLFDSGVGITITASLGISLSIYYGNISYIAVYVFWGLLANSFISISRYLSAISILICDYLVQILFNIYPSYELSEFLSVLIGFLLFCIIPTKALTYIKDRLCLFKEKQIIRQAINSNRLMLSNRLYELSGVFLEMSSAFNQFKKAELSKDKIKNTSIKNINENVCKNCNMYSSCKENKGTKNIGIEKMLEIGIAKGKLSLIDLPNEISSLCIHPNEIIFALNKFVGEYRSLQTANLNLSNSRALISKETEGIAEILKGLALESGTLLKYQNKLERTLNDELLKKGFFVSEILIYGEGSKIRVSMILTMKEFSLVELQQIVSKCLKTQMILCDKNNTTEEKIYLSFKKKVDYDAVFGIAKRTKTNSEISGDTHSIVRLNDEKFLVALSDGMGSGTDAESISSISLSLIESFYKAGMNSTLILNTVNKLLSINTEDAFTALDIAVINLKETTIDFIKYGAPYGFIINDGAVKIIESNTLPLGILEEISPSVAQTKLNDGDMILLLTDGISDSFGSSSEIIDFLRTIPAKNPQTLANQILDKAVSISNGVCKDDMTALAVRVFKN